MHTQATILAAVVYNETHWALVMHCRSGQCSSPAFVYDGKRSDVVLDHAHAVMLHSSAIWCNGNQPPIRACQQPFQDDNWSCGWRVLCALDAALDHWARYGELPHKLGDEHVGLTAVDHMINTLAAPDQEKQRIAPIPRPCKRKPLQNPEGDGGKVCKQQKPISLRNKGEALATRHGIDHHVVFQKRHRQAGLPPLSGHWKTFLEALAGGPKTICKVCLELQAEVENPSDHVAPLDAQQEDGSHVPPAPPAPPAGVPVVRRGRPKPGQQLRDVHLWAQQERKDIYKRLVGPKHPYWCTVCCKKIHAFRTCDARYLLEHEKSQAHRKGLGLISEHKVIAVPDGFDDERCPGVMVSDEAFPLHSLSGSFHNWHSAGCPHAKNRDNEPPAILSQIQLTEESDDLRFRSKSCGQNRADGKQVCDACSDLAKRCLKEVAAWSFKVDLGQYSSALLYDPAGAQALLQVIHGRDYKKLGLAGGFMEEVLKISDAKQQIALIKSRFQCYPICRRSASLAKFMALTLPDHTLHASTSEMAIYGDLM